MQPTTFTQLHADAAAHAAATTPDLRPPRPRRAATPPVRGVVLAPGDDGYADAVRPFNLAVVQQPDLVAVPRDAQDVRAAVALARARGLRVAPQRTGHNAAPLGPLDGTMLLRTDALTDVHVDAQARTARVGGGARWADLVPVASAHGLAGLHGSTGDVSIAGYALGGGLSWYGRRHGLASDSVRAIELVTADGRLRRVDHDHDAELFWALRGGGGSFGVVTALELDLHPVPELVAGLLLFDHARAGEVLRAWRRWTTTVDERVSSTGRLLQLPDQPGMPPHLRGRSFAAIDAVALMAEPDAAALLAPLRALGPEVDTFGPVAPADVAELHMDPQHPVPSLVGGQLLGGLDDAAIDAFVAAAGPGSGSPLVVAELRHLGGALRRPAPGHGALAAIDAEYLSLTVGVAGDPQGRAAVAAATDRVAAALAPYDTGRAYLNFTERRAPAAAFFDAATLTRLRAVKSRVDPDDVFRANHPVTR